jgi:hypothetical protein
MVFRDSRRQHDCGRLDDGSLGIAKFEDENNALEKRSGQRRVLKLRYRAY